MSKAGSFIKNILFSILGIFEFVMCVAGIGANISPAKGETPFEPLIAVVPWAVMFALLCLISIGGLVREASGKKMVLTSNIFMRLFAAGTGLSVMFQMTEDDVTLEEMLLLQLVCIVLGISAILIGRKADKLSPAESFTSKITIDNFDIEKAEWHYDAASDEYHHCNISPEVAYADDDLIYEYASMPMAYYLMWLLDRDFVSKEFFSLIPAEVIEAVRSGKESPVCLLECTDYCFSKDMISEEVYNFTNTYYWGSMRRNGFGFGYDSQCASYQFDYFEVVGDCRYYYVNSYSQVLRTKLEEVLDRRFREYNNYVPNKELEHGVETSLRYGWEVDVDITNGADQLDLERCLADFKEPSADKYEKVRQSVLRHAEYCYGSFDDTDEELFDLYVMYYMTVYHSENGEPAYTLRGGYDYGDNEDFSMTVQGDTVYVPLASVSDIPPYSERMEMALALRDADPSDGRSVALIPFEFGGTQSEDNTVFMPTVCADIKEKCDSRIICLTKQGMVLDYKCEPKYKDDRVTGFTVTARDSEGKPVFYDSVEIGE